MCRYLARCEVGDIAQIACSEAREGFRSSRSATGTLQPPRREDQCRPGPSWSRSARLRSLLPTPNPRERPPRLPQGAWVFLEHPNRRTRAAPGRTQRPDGMAGTDRAHPIVFGMYIASAPAVVALLAVRALIGKRRPQRPIRESEGVPEPANGGNLRIGRSVRRYGRQLHPVVGCD